MTNNEKVKIYTEKPSFFETIQQYLKPIQTLLLLGIFIFLVLIWFKLPSNNITKIAGKDVRGFAPSGVMDVRVIDTLPVTVENTPNVRLEQGFGSITVEVENFQEIEDLFIRLFGSISEQIERALNHFSLVNIQPFPVEIIK